MFERIGEVPVTTIALIFSDFNLRTWTLWSMWLCPHDDSGCRAGIRPELKLYQTFGINCFFIFKN